MNFTTTHARGKSLVSGSSQKALLTAVPKTLREKSRREDRPFAIRFLKQGRNCRCDAYTLGKNSMLLLPRRVALCTCRAPSASAATKKTITRRVSSLQKALVRRFLVRRDVGSQPGHPRTSPVELTTRRTTDSPRLSTKQDM